MSRTVVTTYALAFVVGLVFVWSSWGPAAERCVLQFVEFDKLTPLDVVEPRQLGRRMMFVEPDKSMRTFELEWDDVGDDPTCDWPRWRPLDVGSRRVSDARKRGGF